MNNCSNTKSEYEIVTHENIRFMHFDIVSLDFCPRHIHTDFELLYVIDQNLTVTAGSDTLHLIPGDFALFNPDLPHSCYSGTSACQLLLLQFDPAFCQKYYPALKNLEFNCSSPGEVMPEKALSVLQDIMFNIGYHYLGRINGFEFRCMSDLNRLVSLLITHVPHTIYSNDEMLAKQKTRYRMNQILDYIREHYTEKIRLQDIAGFMGLSASYLSHFFKQNLNQSFQSYVNSLRLEHATYLLEKTGLPLIDICLESGFSDPKYFNKAFFAFYHTSPGDFRKLRNTGSRKVSLSVSDLVRNQSPENKKPHSRLSDPETASILRQFHSYDCDREKDYPYHLSDTSLPEENKPE